MSSHHIIRDEQEPALLIWESEILPRHQLEALLEWSPLVMISQEILDWVIAQGIKIDVVQSNEAFLMEVHKKLSHQWPFEIFPASSKALSESLRWLFQRGHQEVHLIISFSKAREIKISKELPRLITFQDHYKSYPAPHSEWKKWMRRGLALEIIGPLKAYTNLKPMAEQTFLVNQDGWVRLQGLENDTWIREGLNPCVGPEDNADPA